MGSDVGGGGVHLDGQVLTSVEELYQQREVTVRREPDIPE